jgi:hypothetical protein
MVYVGTAEGASLPEGMLANGLHEPTLAILNEVLAQLHVHSTYDQRPSAAAARVVYESLAQYLPTLRDKPASEIALLKELASTRARSAQG